VDVCVTGVALQTGKPRFHKSLYQAQYLDRLKERLADIALATSAAPTYFKAARLENSEAIIDGGICANNSAIVAIVDAMGFERPSLTHGKRPTSIKDVWLMSIGTGE
jgi:patatin-like phospholipase/acyl hydrolase